MSTMEASGPSEPRPARASSRSEIIAEALTVNEFMRAYKLGRSSVYKLIQAKKLKSKKILGKRLILVSERKGAPRSKRSGGRLKRNRPAPGHRAGGGRVKISSARNDLSRTGSRFRVRLPGPTQRNPTMQDNIINFTANPRVVDDIRRRAYATELHARTLAELAGYRQSVSNSEIIERALMRLAEVKRAAPQSAAKGVDVLATDPVAASTFGGAA